LHWRVLGGLLLVDLAIACEASCFAMLSIVLVLFVTVVASSHEASKVN
jgi:hypothetical protein